MTAHKHQKQLIRARMARTGESYTTARRHVLVQKGEPPPAAAPRGIHPDSHVFAQVFAAHDLPHDEALLFGLGGGAGFLSFVFEYAGHPPIYAAIMRRWSMSHEFGRRAVERSGVGIQVQETGGAKTAAKHLDAALDAGQPFLCLADVALLPHHGMSIAWKGNAPQLVGIFGRADERIELEDHGRRTMTMADFAAARAGYKKAKHGLYRITGGLDDAALANGIRAALEDCAAGLLDPQMGNFQNNFGVRGIRTLADMLTDTRTKKGMPQRFDGHRARLLGRLYECVRQDWSGAGALRGLWADFLVQAQSRLGLTLPIQAFRESGERWEAFAQAAVAELPALKARIDARVDGIWAGEGTEEMIARRAAVDTAMSADPGWSDGEWHDKLAALSAMLLPIAALEEHAAQSMRAALG